MKASINQALMSNKVIIKIIKCLKPEVYTKPVISHS
jgi:hypothetical protein